MQGRRIAHGADAARRGGRGRRYRLAALLGLALSAALTLSACRGDPAREIFETAKFEELQNNPGHARQLYERIVRHHPDSPYASQARTRLQELPAAE